jgi:nucleotide-binding universal stress UspA family protein
MFALRRILHPTDFSQPADDAFQLACALARDYNALLVVLHVSTPFVAYDLAAALPPGYSDGLQSQLDRIDPHDPRVRFERRLVQGDPAAEIVRFAGEASCDLIVMGTHGRTGLSRLLMGSVAERVSRKAPCPVLTAKTPLPAEDRSIRASTAVGAR